MNVAEFKVLHRGDQEKLLVTAAAHIADRYEPDYHVVLFQLDGFYIEAFYNNRLNKLITVCAFTSMDRLMPYLQRIDLRSLLA